MAKSSAIAWTDSTFNPWKICTPLGPGCDNCYAAAMSRRFGWGEYAQGVPRQRTSASNWKQPIAWNKKAAASGKPWRVFCASLADVFDNEAPQQWRDDLWRLIEATPHLSWLLVTKRIGNVARMVPSLDWLAMHDNVRILITVVNQEEADRDIPKLLALPCKNGIIYEPDLGPVDFHGMWSKQVERAYIGHYVPGMYRKLQWIIVGGESAQGRRPTRAAYIAWARDAIAQCRAAGVPV
ncbi:MAG: DUF5131 family protein, partial [Betaproteobacteria bacterium]|nr:DUF5131 family protein [Betaproteobacteria bacterium]